MPRSNAPAPIPISQKSFAIGQVARQIAVRPPIPPIVSPIRPAMAVVFANASATPAITPKAPSSQARPRRSIRALDNIHSVANPATAAINPERDNPTTSAAAIAAAAIVSHIARLSNASAEISRRPASECCEYRRAIT